MGCRLGIEQRVNALEINRPGAAVFSATQFLGVSLPFDGNLICTVAYSRRPLIRLTIVAFRVICSSYRVFYNYTVSPVLSQACPSFPPCP